MKLYAINGSPRKGWNDAQLLDEFKQGVLSILPDADYHEVFLYDLNYRGCRSCFGCKLKTLDEPRCAIKDDLYDLLHEIRHSDGFVYASPIYFSDASAELKAFFERLMYPGPVKQEIPVHAIYTMNAKKEKFETAILPKLESTHQSLEHNFKTTVNITCAYYTFQRNNEELYKPSSHSKPEDKLAYRALHWKEDLQTAYSDGAAFARKILQSNRST